MFQSLSEMHQAIIFHNQKEFSYGILSQKTEFPKVNTKYNCYL